MKTIEINEIYFYLNFSVKPILSITTSTINYNIGDFVEINDIEYIITKKVFKFIDNKQVLKIFLIINDKKLLCSQQKELSMSVSN